MNEPQSRIVVFFLNNPVVVRSVLYVTLSGLGCDLEKMEQLSEKRDAGAEVRLIR
jgi:hypothetical protein